MLTVATIFAALLAGTRLPGRHVVVTAHADDETVSCASVLQHVPTHAAQLVQITTGAPAGSELMAQRQQERAAALAALDCRWSVVDGAVPGREAHRHLWSLLAVVQDAIADADVVWTHPYEGGHLDHDSAAWLVQTACARRDPAPLRLEFASYHSHAGRHSTFGAFWPDLTVAQVVVPLTGDARTRKHAALAAYASQAHILRKFPTPDREPYRVARVYDFTRPAAPPFARWDTRSYQPTTAAWRQMVAVATRALEDGA